MSRMGVVLAAGGSRRFGADDKLLALWRGRPLVAWAAGALRESGCEELVAVVSSADVAAVLPAGFAVHHLPPGLPMSASLRLALRLARQRGAEGLLVCLGDMPNITAAVLQQLLLLPGSGACLQGGRRLPPAYIMSEDFSFALGAQDGDHGARDLIEALPDARLIQICRNMAHDVDRPADLTGPA